MSANGKYEDYGSMSHTHKIDDEDRKLFLGGLAWDTTEEDLRNYFSTYGTVEAVSIKHDAVTRNPRGFGFITFASTDDIENVLQVPTHTVRDKVIDPKRAKSRPICKKIFVGGIDANLDEEEIRQYFTKYGKVEGVELPFDRTRGKRREFCFIIFDTEEGADLACHEPKQMIGQRECDVKKAQPQPLAQQMKRQNQMSREGGDDDGRDSRGGRGGSSSRGRDSRSSHSSYGASSDAYGYGNGYSSGSYANAGYYGYPGYSQGGYDYSQYYSQYGYGQGYGDYWSQYGYPQGYGAEGEYPTTGYAAGSQSGTQEAYGSRDTTGSQSSSHSSSHGHHSSTGKMITTKSSSSNRAPSSSYHPYGGRGSNSSH
jgi:RNA recognition motif-containing protein